MGEILTKPMRANIDHCTPKTYNKTDRKQELGHLSTNQLPHPVTSDC